MSKRTVVQGFGVAAGALLVLLAPAVQASRPLAGVTGVVSAAPTSDRIVVDGKTYRIHPNSVAVSQHNAIRPGQKVDLVLSPSRGSESEPVVLSITPHGSATEGKP